VFPHTSSVLRRTMISSPHRSEITPLLIQRFHNLPISQTRSSQFPFQIANFNLRHQISMYASSRKDRFIFQVVYRN